MANSKFTFTDGVLKTSSAIPVEGIDLHVISPAAYSPVSFRGIPYYLNTLWTDLKAIAPPDLRLTMTDPLFRILLKFTLRVGDEGAIRSATLRHTVKPRCSSVKSP
uniref:Uncharacterized protein n=1 Tax=Cacopsylla melanoneura TaxID=428564 RepID=A0A8D8LD99_9HEMI